MRKIILGVAVSLDNLIEGPHGEYDWCFTDQDYGMGEFLKNIDSIFYGRKSYEMMMKAGETEQNPFGGKMNYVFSNTWQQGGKDFQLVTGDSLAEVKRIKEMEGKDIWLFGGASLTSSLMNAGLVDEMWLAIHPIVLGKGKPLFAGIEGRIKTKLIGNKLFDTGLLSVRYEVLK
jgi:dihydrofolate reductase